MPNLTLIAAGLLCVAGCSFDSTGGDGGPDEGSTGTTGTDTSGSPSSSASSASTRGPTADATSMSSTDPGSGTTTVEPTSESSDSTGARPLDGCPDSLPEDWIFCEDFEELAALDEVFHVGPGTNFTIDDGASFSGDQSLLIEHPSGASWVGDLRVRFGDAVVSRGPVFASDARFDEIWVRARVYLDPGWSSNGHGNLFEIESLQANEAAVVRGRFNALENQGIGQVLALSCVFGGSIPCDGNMDWQDEEILDAGNGTTAVFNAAEAGNWHCVTGRVRLNSPGQTDGEMEMSIDGSQEVLLTGLDLRERMTEPGLNSVWLSTFWGGGPAQNVSRHMDDIVISRSDLSCD